ncbi:MAG: acetyl-CoA C-acetyltransferase [Syntrophotaleaceae bacterium]
MNEDHPSNHSNNALKQRPVYIVDGSRTPFLKVRGKPGPFSPVDLAVQCGRPLLLRQDLPPDAFDMVILGCVNVLAHEMNPARLAALRLGLGETMPAFTVQINCGSGMLSIDNAFRSIASGSQDLVLAGGAEALSQAPLLAKPEAVAWLAQMREVRSPAESLRLMKGWRANFLKPVLGLKQGLTDPVAGLSMGQTTEILAHLFATSREEADRYALESHQRLSRAQTEGWLEDEIEAAISPTGELFQQDDGVRPDSTLEALSRLKPVFEPPFGLVTAGNSSQVTDGASWVILASEKALKQYRLTPKAVIIDSAWAALDPRLMGLGPVLAATEILQRWRAALADIDLWEINEAFAAQVLACLRAWEDGDFCKGVLGLDQPLGRIDREKLNIDGGAISLGHPVGASGNRILLHLVNALHRKDLKVGIATECIGGGQGGAMLVEKI